MHELTLRARLRGSPLHSPRPGHRWGAAASSGGAAAVVARRRRNRRSLQPRREDEALAHNHAASQPRREEHRHHNRCALQPRGEEALGHNPTRRFAQSVCRRFAATGRRDTTRRREQQPIREASASPQPRRAEARQQRKRAVRLRCNSVVAQRGSEEASASPQRGCAPAAPWPCNHGFVNVCLHGPRVQPAATRTAQPKSAEARLRCLPRAQCVVPPPCYNLHSYPTFSCGPAAHSPKPKVSWGPDPLTVPTVQPPSEKVSNQCTVEKGGAPAHCVSPPPLRVKTWHTTSSRLRPLSATRLCCLVSPPQASSVPAFRRKPCVPCNAAMQRCL